MRLVMKTKVTISLAALALSAAGCGKAEAQKGPATPPPAPQVEVLELKPSEVRETGNYLGSLLTRQSVTIVPQIAGFVRDIKVRPGQRVTAGQTLFHVDARQEVAAVDSARAQVASAQANYALAQQTRARSEALFAEGIASAQERDAARAQEEAAAAAVKAAEAQASQREVQLQYFAVRAPFSGVVGEVTTRLGALVSAASPLTTLNQSDVLEVSVGVPAHRARTLQPGAPLELVGNQGEVLVRTQVFYIAPEADPATQLVTVKAVFENDAGLRPSELVRARIVYSTREAVQIPAMAVVRQSGQAFALAIDQVDGKSVIARRPIALGALGSSSYVVESGLKEGDVVAVSMIQALRDGAVIAPQSAKQPAESAKNN